MNAIFDLIVNGGLPLLLGILAGQRVRITLDGKKVPVKVRSPKGTGKSAKRIPRAAADPLPSPSPQEPELPWQAPDPAS